MIAPLSFSLPWPAVLVAQAFKSASPESIGAFAVTAASVLFIVKTALDLWKTHFKEDPNPRATYVPRPEIVQMIETAELRCKTAIGVSDGTLDDIRDDWDDRHKQNSARLDRLEATHREELGKVHERLNQAVIGIAKIEGEIKHVGASAEKAANSAVLAAEAARGAIQAASQRGGH